jgi:hypothetical protein
MTCADSSFFDTTDGALDPLRRWQWAQRATAQGGGATFTPASNVSPGTVLFTVNVAWTNDTGISQQVYALMTQGPQRYSIDGLKDLTIRTRWGVSSGTSPADPTLTDESLMRGYGDLGTGSTGSGGGTAAIYFLLEDRQPTNSVPIGDIATLTPGQQMKAKVEVSWYTSAWGIDWYTTAWGDPIPSRLGKVGPVRLDLFSVPVIP